MVVADILEYEHKMFVNTLNNLLPPQMMDILARVECLWQDSCQAELLEAAALGHIAKCPVTVHQYEHGEINELKEVLIMLFGS